MVSLCQIIVHKALNTTGSRSNSLCFCGAWYNSKRLLIIRSNLRVYALLFSRQYLQCNYWTLNIPASLPDSSTSDSFRFA